MKSLSVSERDPPDLKENLSEGEMDMDTERKRKREEAVKEKSSEINHDETSTEEIPKNTNKNYPNIKSLPQQVQNIVSSGSKEAVVPGNGTCLIGTTAVHIEGDTENTAQLAMNLNTHIAMYRDIYLPKIEADFPLTVTIGVAGETKIFPKGQEQEFFDWLMSSPGAVYMWRGCLDIIALSNMLRMDVDCIVHEEGSVPEVYHFSPDLKFPFNDEDILKPKNPEELKYPKMTVLNYKNNHYNLIVDKNSMVAQLGSFSHQRELAKNNNKTKYKIPLEENLQNKIKGLEQALKESLSENQRLKEKLHSRSTMPDHNKEDFNHKCEECGKTYADSITLNDHINIEHFIFSYICPKCNKGFTQKQNFTTHKSNHCKLQENCVCTTCSQSFQNKDQLASHMKKEHQPHNFNGCQYCDKIFPTQEDLNNHEENSHQFNCME